MRPAGVLEHPVAQQPVDQPFGLVPGVFRLDRQQDQQPSADRATVDAVHVDLGLGDSLQEADHSGSDQRRNEASNSHNNSAILRLSRDRFAHLASQYRQNAQLEQSARMTVSSTLSGILSPINAKEVGKGGN